MITKLNKSGLEQYGNIDASMAANGNVDTIIGCYHLVGITDYQVKDVDYGYNVTVKGILTNYNGTIQFAKDCEVVSFTAGSRNDIPGIKTTPADIVDAAYALADGQSMYVDYTLTGVITNVDTAYSSDNENITVTIAVEGKEDKPIMCYRLKGDGVDVIKVGDTITVTGTLKNYKNTIEFDTGCRLDSYQAGSGEVTPPAGGGDADLTSALAIFEFGDDVADATEHVDGSSLNETAEYTSGNYTLSLTGISKVYGGANDATGISCLKMGTSSAVGTLSFTVDNTVNQVVIKIAKYKAKTSKVTINGTEYTLTNSSDNGAYDVITIDTSTTKTVTISTVSGACRVMLNSIAFFG